MFCMLKLFILLKSFPLDGLYKMKKTWPILLEMMLSYHRSLLCITRMKGTGLGSNPYQNGQIMENSFYFHSNNCRKNIESFRNYWQIFFNYVFRLYFIMNHHLINTTHLGTYREKYCSHVFCGERRPSNPC